MVRSTSKGSSQEAESESPDRSKSLSKSRSPLRRGTSPKSTAKYKRPGTKEMSDFNDSEFSPQRKRASPFAKKPEQNEFQNEGRQYLQELKVKKGQEEALLDSKSSLQSSTVL